MAVRVIISGRWVGLRVGDSKAFEDSVPGLDLLEKWYALSKVP